MQNNVNIKINIIKEFFFPSNDSGCPLYMVMIQSVLYTW